MNKNGIYVLLVGLVIIGCVTFSFGIQSNAATNGYVKKYLLEEKKKKENPEQDTIDMLNEYYSADVKLQKIVLKYNKDKNLNQAITSTDFNKKRNVMYAFIKLIPNIKDSQDKNAFLEYLQRYVSNGEIRDGKVEEFLNKIEGKSLFSTQKATTTVDEAYEKNMKNGKSSDATGDEIKKENQTAHVAKAFNRVNAGKWAYKNYNKYSKSYPKFTGKYNDCTNFVSQALHTGGKLGFFGKWKIHRKNKKYWNINSAKKLDYSWSVTDPSPWMSARTFNSYMRSKAKYTFNYSNNYYRIHYKSIYNQKIYRGSAVIFLEGVAGISVKAKHVMIMSSYNSKTKDILLAGHSTERQKYSLRNAIKNYSEVNIYTF